MNKTYLKLEAKRKIHKNTFRFFLVGALPFFTIILLASGDFYFIRALEKSGFLIENFVSPYDKVIYLTISAILIVISFLLTEIASLYSQKFFYGFVNGKNKITFSQYLSYVAVIIIRFLLSISWSVVYYFPCITVSGLLIYCYRYENYGYNVNLTLFVSAAILFFIGSIFQFVTMKRYSFCTFLLFTQKERNPLKIIAKSIEMSENHCAEYAFYSLSLVGWVVSCVFIVPIIYVIPYVTMCRWTYFCNIDKKEIINEKPIIFYIQKRKV